MEQTPGKHNVLLVYIALALATLIVFQQVRLNGFVNYDDGIYVTENPNVKSGITAKSVLWALGAPHMGHWHPLTWLSHMLDCQLFGLNPTGHHITSLLFHIANMLLLFWVLKEMTDAVWPSAFVATAFALHPIHVESVAWVAERKDVLSGLFWFLTITAYIQYAKRPGIVRYLMVFLCLSLGLMAKSMLITLPFVLLLLDFWPLGRIQSSRQSRTKPSKQIESQRVNFQSSSLRHLIIEKLPLFILVLAFCAMAFVAQRTAGAVVQTETSPLDLRIDNALVSYIRYILKMIYPARLAVLYPFLGDRMPKWQPPLSLLLLIIISALVLYTARRRRRYLITGWFWYLGTLAPVIGLVQTGSQAIADRYTYLPSIGFFIIVAWAVPELLAKWRYRKIILTASMLAVLWVLSVCTVFQLRHWRSSITLFEHTAKVTKNNHIAYDNLGCALAQQHRLDEAVENFTKALRIKHDFDGAHNNLGCALLQQGKFAPAVAHFEQALRINSNFASAHKNLADALFQHGSFTKAAAHYKKALQIKSDFVSVHARLAYALEAMGDFDQAVEHYTEALQAEPDRPDILNNLAWLLATHKNARFHNPKKAVYLAERACRLTKYEDPGLLDTLAAAYEAAGDSAKAAETAEKVKRLTSPSQHNDSKK